MCFPFIYKAFWLWDYVDALWEHGEKISELCQISPKLLYFFIGFNPILYRLQRCLSIFSSLLARFALHALSIRFEPCLW